MSMPAAVRVELGDLDSREVQVLLEEHLADMYATSPAESVHALDLSGLKAADVTFWTARRTVDDVLVGCVALRDFEDDAGPAGELKSMRTTAAARGAGAGTALLVHVLAESAGRGHGVLWLETGAEDLFAPARRLYARHGFEECGPFGSYRPDRHSVFMRRLVAPPSH